MNYYERIQNSLYYIEANLDNELTIEDCAREAFMSVSGYYRLFLSTVGYNVKEYIRLRRLTLALADIQGSENPTVITVAFRYLYNSADSFTRAFKKQFGILPSQAKSSSEKMILNKFERINIMEKYFETDNTELIEKYPDIKVIRELEDMKVACFTYFGPEPEGNAFEVLKKWVKKNHISLRDSAYRIFGYNNPDPSDPSNGEELYGYEVCVTIPDSLYDTLDDVPIDFTNETYDSVKRKVIKGGKYAVMSVKRGSDGDIGTNIMHAWQRFGKWIEEGKYIWGGRQYLEEHLGFNDEDDHIGGVEIYLPVENASKALVSEKEEMLIPPCRVAMFRVDGNDAEGAAHVCWNKAVAWARKNGIDSADCRIFEYNKGFDRRPPFFHVIMLTLPAGFDEKAAKLNDDITFDDFSGGKYMTVATDLKHLGDTWMLMEKWRNETKTAPGSHQWVEECFLDNWTFPMKKILVCYPIQ